MNLPARQGVFCQESTLFRRVGEYSTNRVDTIYLRFVRMFCLPAAPVLASWLAQTNKMNMNNNIQWSLSSLGFRKGTGPCLDHEKVQDK